MTRLTILWGCLVSGVALVVGFGMLARSVFSQPPAAYFYLALAVACGVVVLAVMVMAARSAYEESASTVTTLTGRDNTPDHE